MAYSIKVISKDGDFLSLAYRMLLAGHEVDVYLENKSKMYNGIIPKAHDINDLDIERDDMVIFDMVGSGVGADKLKDHSIHVVGGGALNDSLELHRQFGMQYMEDNGIPVPEYSTLYEEEQARELIGSTGKRYVFKPDGNLSTDLTYVATSPENMSDMLPYLFSKVPENTPVIMQEFVEGVEMSTEAWFNGDEFMRPINSTMEEKKFMAGDLGPNTGCAGNVVWWWDEEKSEKLYQLLFKQMEPKLREARYMGPIDINCIWTKDGPMGLEFTTRFGYDAIQAASRLIDMEFGEFLYKLPQTNMIPITSDKYALAIRVSIPPYPNDGEVPEVPIGALPEELEDNVYLSDVFSEPGGLVCAGTDGYVCAVADTGHQISKIQERVANIIDRLEIPSKQYRIDVGSRVSGDRALLFYP